MTQHVPKDRGAPAEVACHFFSVDSVSAGPVARQLKSGSWQEERQSTSILMSLDGACWLYEERVMHRYWESSLIPLLFSQTQAWKLNLRSINVLMQHHEKYIKLWEHGALWFFIEHFGVTLVNKKLYGFLVHNSVAHHLCVVCSPPQVKSPSITVYLPFTLCYLFPHTLRVLM